MKKVRIINILIFYILIFLIININSCPTHLGNNLISCNKISYKDVLELDYV